MEHNTQVLSAGCLTILYTNQGRQSRTNLINKSEDRDTGNIHPL